MPRPFALDPLFKPVTALPGIGDKLAPLFTKAAGPKILDILWHAPIDLVLRHKTDSVAKTVEGSIHTLGVRVDALQPAPRRGLPSRVQCSDESGTLDIVYFNVKRPWLESRFPIGESVVVSGKIENYHGKKQMPHPDFVEKEGDEDLIPGAEPVYPLTAGLTNRTVRKAISHGLKLLPALPEWQDEAFKKKKGWPDWHDCIKALHHPQAPPEIEPESLVRQRLAYDELLAGQLSLALVRLHQKKLNGRQWPTRGTLRQKLTDVLPFRLTKAQEDALREIDGDMGEAERMLRLLQGDVGSGKTIVAALAMANVLDGGAQAAIMAPTEILARQHLESFAPLFEPLGIEIALLSGRVKGKARQELLGRLEGGQIKILIGTHALFQESVSFQNLGLAVIDEQHRFGVQQRLSLSQKTKGCDVLVMTATPIPRTLTLTAYGDMDVSRIAEKPPGRQPIDTRLYPQDKIDTLIGALAEQVKRGAQAYWVCPLVEESEVLDVQAAESRYDILKERFGTKVGLVHGRMKGEEKNAVMGAFARGELQILVATTVIEVGVNVPNATIMVIEQAERFGLAQLHQLRGRVGRGAAQSYCFLVYASKIGETAQERLRLMRESEDGFFLAEKDLELRGGGEILGHRQSGLPTYRFADLAKHGELLQAALDDAKLILLRDEHLETARGEALKHLLYLFEQDQAITRLRAG